MKQEPESFNKVYNYIDSTGGDTAVINTILHAAKREGFHVESDMDRLGTVNTCLDQAMEEMDTDEKIDAEKVLGRVDSANQALHDLQRGMNSELRNWDIPEHISSGVYKKVDPYLNHVRDILNQLVTLTEMWIEERE